MLQFALSLCRGENEKWADPLLISRPGLCFGGNRQRLLRHFRRLKHEPVREKTAKNVFAGVFAQIESILFSSENHTISVLYFSCMRIGKICCAFLFLFGLIFHRVISQFSPGLPFAVDRSLRESPTPCFPG